jgi:hypothetical protein
MQSGLFAVGDLLQVCGCQNLAAPSTDGDALTENMINKVIAVEGSDIVLELPLVHEWEGCVAWHIDGVTVATATPTNHPATSFTANYPLVTYAAENIIIEGEFTFTCENYGAKLFTLGACVHGKVDGATIHGRSILSCNGMTDFDIKNIAGTYHRRVIELVDGSHSTRIKGIVASPASDASKLTAGNTHQTAVIVHQNIHISDADIVCAGVQTPSLVNFSNGHCSSLIDNSMFVMEAVPAGAFNSMDSSVHKFTNISSGSLVPSTVRNCKFINKGQITGHASLRDTKGVVIDGCVFEGDTSGDYSVVVASTHKDIAIKNSTFPKQLWVDTACTISNCTFSALNYANEGATNANFSLARISGLVRTEQDIVRAAVQYSDSYASIEKSGAYAIIREIYIPPNGIMQQDDYIDFDMTWRTVGSAAAKTVRVVLGVAGADTTLATFTSGAPQESKIRSLSGRLYCTSNNGRYWKAVFDGAAGDEGKTGLQMSGSGRINADIKASGMALKLVADTDPADKVRAYHARIVPVLRYS